MDNTNIDKVKELILKLRGKEKDHRTGCNESSSSYSNRVGCWWQLHKIGSRQVEERQL